MVELQDVLMGWKPEGKRSPAGLPWQLFEGMQRTLLGTLKVSNFLLTKFPGALVHFHCFRQNLLENHFSMVRSGCGSHNAPSMATYGPISLSVAEAQMGKKTAGVVSKALLRPGRNCAPASKQ